MNRLQSLRQPARSWGGLDSMIFNGLQYPLFGLNQTLTGKIEDIDVGYTSLVYRAYSSNAIVFACMRARLMLFTEARFGFQNMRGGRGADFFGDRDRPDSQLAVLDKPWPGATTGDLLKYLITDADLAGNAFVARQGNTLKRLRPDWTRIVHGSPNPDGSMWDPDAVLLGYAYQPGGPSLGRPWISFDATQVAHFAPIPDPLQPVRGMSWLSPIVREVMGDQAATEHKLKFFEQGGTPNLLIKTEYTDLAKLNEFMQFVRQNHEGIGNAYKMMGFTQGVDATVVGKDLQQLDFKVVQGAGETRIAAAAGVPPAVAGLSEGLQGSSLNAGNFQAAMRMFADLTMRPLWRNVAGSLERIIPPPTGTRLWYDDRDVPALKDDIKDAAEVQGLQATAIRTLTDGGWEPDAIIDAVTSGDLSRLKGKHTGLLPVQLQLPGKGIASALDQTAPMPMLMSGRGDDALRCGGCNRLLAERAGSGTRITCGRCGVVNETLVRVEAPPTVMFGDGAFRFEVHAPEPSQPSQVNFHEGAFRIDSPVTIADGAVQTLVTIAEGAVRVEAHSPDIHVDAPAITVEAPQITVEPSPVTISEGAIQVSNPVTVEPSSVHIAEGAVRIVEHVLTRTVIDRDPETNTILGSHEVLVDEG